MQNNDHIKLMIVDDHQMFLDGITSLIKNYSNIVIKHIAKDGLEAINYLKQDNDIDIVISDINMPNLTGLELCRKVRANYPSINVLILSMHNDTATIKDLLNAGALGYILKNTGKDELFEAINVVQNNETYFSEEVKTNIMNSITRAKKAKSNFNVKLSKREIEIIKLIADELTTNEIAEKLFISLHTVESHRKNILRKTSSRNLAGLIKYAVKEGLVE